MQQNVEGRLILTELGQIVGCGRKYQRVRIDRANVMVR